MQREEEPLPDNAHSQGLNSGPVAEKQGEDSAMSRPPPPPIGFIASGDPLPSEVDQMNQQNLLNSGENGLLEETTRAAADSRTPTSAIGIFTHIIFQKLLILSLVRISIYIFKLTQDFNAVGEYWSERDLYFCVISFVSLLVPPFFYAIYLTGANLAKDDILDKTDLSTKTVNGFLLWLWQIKRHLDVLHFAAQRVCQWRSADNLEKEDMQSMERNAEILEFFEDFYSGFLQLLLQLYIFVGTTDWLTGHQLQATPLIGELVGSSLCILSMMIAVRRRDDGPLTGFLSFFGWLSLIVSRILVFTLIATYIHSWLFVLCLVHVLSVSIWVYNIAIESYMTNSSSTSSATAQWTNKRKRASIAVLVFLFFGIPSLLIWPIMFQLKEGRRPLVFLMIITLENLFLLGIWFIFQISVEGLQLGNTHVLLVTAIVMSTLGGVFFLLIYIFCKPKYTDQVVLYEIREAKNAEVPTLIKLNGPNSRSLNATQYGIYYEFCDIVFKLPSTHKIAAGLEEVRRLQAQM